VAASAAAAGIIRRALRRWLGTRQILLGGSVILLLVLVALFAPLLAPFAPDQIGGGRGGLRCPGPATGSAPTSSAATS